MIGAVIVTYNTPKSLLVSCLQSLRENNIRDVVIVANDESQEVQKTARRQGLSYLKNDHNCGFAAAANLGAHKLSNPYLLFINPDVKLDRGACLRTLNYLQKNKKTGIAGLLLYSDSGKIEHKSFGDIVTPLSLFSRFFTNQKTTISSQPIKVGWVSGGGIVIRRDLFFKVKGFDPSFFMYWEDVDLCRRAQNVGYDVHLLPFARAYHRRGASFPKEVNKTALYDKSADNYFRKYYPKPIWILLRSTRRFYRLISPRAD